MNPGRRTILRSALAGLLCQPAFEAWAQSSRPASRPNVVLIAVDDLNVSLSPYSNSIVITPSIQRLAGHGVVFQKAYCQFPVCNPSRTSFLSGLLPERTGVLNNAGHFIPTSADPPLLPRLFHSNGWRTLRMGKLFHDSRWMREGKRLRTTDDPDAWDVSEDEPAEAAEDDDSESSASGARPTVSSAQLDIIEDKTGDGIVARRAAALLVESAATNQPFFLAAGFRKPHYPLNAPRKYFDLYDRARIPLHVEPPDHRKSILPIALNRYFAEDQPPDEVRKAIHAYYACISFMDAQVGIILDALDRLRLWDNTIVAFLSDNGCHQGEHGMWGKNTLFEPSAQVPLIIAAPSAVHGISCTNTVELLDLYPTLANLCGLPVHANLHGRSLLPLLTNPNQKWDRPAYTILRRNRLMGRSLRNQRFRYTEWDDGRSGVELYDHDADPGEFRNLAEDPRFASARQELSTLLQMQKARARL